MEGEPLIYREEVTAIMGVLADLNANTTRIRELLEEEIGGEDQEDDA